MTPEQEREYVDYVTVRLPALRRVAYFLCGDEHRADDLVQQTMTSLYVHWVRARAMANLEGYVRRILVRAHLSERRLSWSSRVRLVGGAPPEHPSAPAGEAEDRAVVQAALAQVPPRQRAVLVLRFLCDLPVDEVADLLGCSAGTVKSQTSHGLATLRRLLGDTALANMG
jgi:RNA polymerase sigma-70 factor (sigma-E family)